METFTTWLSLFPKMVFIISSGHCHLRVLSLRIWKARDRIFSAITLDGTENRWKIWWDRAQFLLQFFEIRSRSLNQRFRTWILRSCWASRLRRTPWWLSLRTLPILWQRFQTYHKLDPFFHISTCWKMDNLSIWDWKEKNILSLKK